LELNFVRIFLFLGFLLLTATSALAQTAGVPFVSWSGPYAGLDGGYAGGHSDQTDSGFPASAPVASAPATNSAGSATAAPAATSTSPPPFHFESDGAGLTIVSSSSSRPIISGGSGLIIVNGDGHYSVRGGLIGGTLGYNWQLGHWVFGIEGDYDWADVAGRSLACGSSSATPHSCGSSLDSLGTLRGRIGYAAGSTGSLLPYLTGGLLKGN
jgi:hypothetical protein